MSTYTIKAIHSYLTYHDTLVELKWLSHKSAVSKMKYKAPFSIQEAVRKGFFYANFLPMHIKVFAALWHLRALLYIENKDSKMFYKYSKMVWCHFYKKYSLHDDLGDLSIFSENQNAKTKTQFFRYFLKVTTNIGIFLLHLTIWVPLALIFLPLNLVTIPVSIGKEYWHYCFPSSISRGGEILKKFLEEYLQGKSLSKALTGLQQLAAEEAIAAANLKEPNSRIAEGLHTGMASAWKNIAHAQSPEHSPILAANYCEILWAMGIRAKDISTMIESDEDLSDDLEYAPGYYYSQQALAQLFQKFWEKGDRSIEKYNLVKIPDNFNPNDPNIFDVSDRSIAIENRSHKYLMSRKILLPSRESRGHQYSQDYFVHYDQYHSFFNSAGQFRKILINSPDNPIPEVFVLKAKTWLNGNQEAKFLKRSNERWSQKWQQAHTGDEKKTAPHWVRANRIG